MTATPETWSELGRKVALVVNELRRQGVGVTPRRVEQVWAQATTPPPTVAEIEAALEGTGCVAVLNEATGQVRVFKPPVAAHAATTLEALRRAVAEARTARDHAEAEHAGWAARTRCDQALQSAERALAAAEFDRQGQRRREQTGQWDAEPPELQFAEPVPYWVKSEPPR